MQTAASLEEDGAGAASSQLHPDATMPRRKHAVRFTDWDREDQLQAFFAWLPKELHDAPGIDWTTIPPGVMGYCVRTIGNSPDAAHLAIAVASALGAINTRTLLSLIGDLNILLRTFRSECQMQGISDLHQEQLWQRFLAKTKPTSSQRKQVKAYRSVTVGHFPSYLHRLTAPNRLRMRAYAFPPMPHEFLKHQLPYRAVTAAAQARRKAQSDVLVPLYPVLRQLVRFRKQLAERTLLAIREARRKVEAGQATLPLPFSHTDTIPQVNRDARTISEVQIQGREVTMQFILWDKRTWVLHHTDRYCHDIVKDAQVGRRTYKQEQNSFFVQYEGPSSDLLWIGDLIEQRLLQQFEALDSQDPGYNERWQLARKLGFSNGCQCYRPGLLNSGDRWFSDSVHRDGQYQGDFLFEPESLYRGVLFGATLAMIALSNGSRVSELLQVSWNKQRRITRTETVMMIGEDGQQLAGADGKPMMRQVKIHLQHLLPKGAKTEEERQLFPLSKESMRLIGEIRHLLEEAHGSIPTVHPSRSSTKYEHLKPEQYLFQWAATADGTHGILSITDVQTLLRFIFHGLDLYTTQGEPIRVSVHVLRHVMATHARHYRHVPPEAIAHFFLHHRILALTGRDPSPSEISSYYFQMTEQQRFAILRTELDEQEELDRALLQTAPSLRDLEQKNADLQAVYDEWHTLHPTALGNCGCPGLCPRGNDRALCLGCSYHVEDPEKIGAALAWRASYAKQAEVCEAQGNVIDARQARIKVQMLDDLITVMRMQVQKEAEGTYIPLHKILPSPYRGREVSREEEC